jgi:hypothetical protein
MNFPEDVAIGSSNDKIFVMDSNSTTYRVFLLENGKRNFFLEISQNIPATFFSQSSCGSILFFQEFSFRRN